MTRERLEQNPEQQNAPDTHELDSLLTDIRTTQQKLEQRSGADITGLQNQLTQVKNDVLRFHEDKEIIWNKNELEQLRQRVQTIKQQVETAAVASVVLPDTQELLVAADKGRAVQADSVMSSLQNPQSGIGALDNVLKWFGDRV